MTGTASDTATGVSLSGGAATGASGSEDNSGKSQTTTPVTPPTGKTEGEGGSAAPWYSTVEDAALKSLAETKGWKSPTDAIKSYKELETAFSQRPEAPVVPKDITEYKFTPPADIPKDAYNEKFAEGFKTWAHEAKLSVAQAAQLHDSFVNYAKEAMGGSAAEANAQLATQVSTAANELQADWGKMDTPGFTRNVEMARRAIRNADPGLMDALRSVGVIATVDGQDMVRNAPIMKAFAKMGAGMYAEDRLHGTPSTDKNPFDDANRDMAMQGRLMREDPDKAALLIRAAGQDKLFSQFLEKHARGKK